MADKQYFDDKWNELSKEYRQKVVEFLRSHLEPAFFEGLKIEFEKDRENWNTKGGWHFAQGMSIRNMLRSEGKFTDDQLPDENWDDYYCQALEAAAGLRDV